MPTVGADPRDPYAKLAAEQSAKYGIADSDNNKFLFALPLKGSNTMPVVTWNITLVVGEKSSAAGPADLLCSHYQYGFAENIINYRGIVEWEGGATRVHYVSCLKPGKPIRDVDFYSQSDAQLLANPPFVTSNPLALQSVANCGDRVQLHFEDSPLLVVPWELPKGKMVRNVSLNAEFDVFLIEKARPIGGYKIADTPGNSFAGGKVMAGFKYTVAASAEFSFNSATPVAARTAGNQQTSISAEKGTLSTDPAMQKTAPGLKTRDFPSRNKAEMFPGSCP